ncbi:MAG: transketolase [Planctomycetota bacterium]|nr:transketolase [Planctomycetota bacterium]
MPDVRSETLPTGAGTLTDDPAQNRSLADRTVATVKTLAMDAVEQAASGHAGTPMGLARLAYALWTQVMKYDPADPAWPDRDRFVLSCGHASMLQYAMLHLTGYDLSLDDIRAFRQWGSRAAGHPEYGEAPGVETTTGPLGQGIGNAVGMALAERMLAARFNSDAHTLVDHRTWAIASDGDLMEGVAAEAASLAGHLGLGKLCVFWDDNRITIDGATDLSFSEDVGGRFESLGWHVIRLETAGDAQMYVHASEAAAAVTDRPTLVCCRTHIGESSPNKQDTSDAHGAPLGAAEIRLTKAALGWPEDAAFLVPDDVRDHMRSVGQRGASARRAWLETSRSFTIAEPERAAEFERRLSGALPEGWDAALPSFSAGSSVATRKASGKTLAALGATIPELIGGSCDLAGSNNTTIAGAQDVTPGRFEGRTLHFGVREHGMGSVLNGLALHGGMRPYGGTFLVFSDYMRASIRLAALMKLPVVYVFTHDSIGVGEDGPTHQPVEHVASLRAMPGLHVVRPGDAAETVEAWRLALQRAGPTVLCLTRQGLPVVDRSAHGAAAGLHRGAYVLREGALKPDVVLLATGSEVGICLAAAEALLREGVAARVVSMPCWEAFEALAAPEREAVFGGCDVRVGVEAGCSLGWHRWVGARGALVTLDRFGASAPAGVLMEKFGFTAENVAAVARRALASAEGTV